MTWDKRGSIRGQRLSISPTILGAADSARDRSPGPAHLRPEPPNRPRRAHPEPEAPVGEEFVVVEPAWGVVVVVVVVVVELGRSTGFGFWITA